MPILGFTYTPILDSMVVNTNTVNAVKGDKISDIDTVIGPRLNFCCCESMRNKTGKGFVHNLE